MSIARFLGLSAATFISSTMVLGAAALVVTDFLNSSTAPNNQASTDESLATPKSDAETRKDDLVGIIEQMRNLTFFSDQVVPGLKLKIVTGTSYTSVEDLLADKFNSKWCYTNQGVEGSAFGNRIDLGKRTGFDAPVFVNPSEIGANQAAIFGVTADELTAHAREYCKFELTNVQD